MNSLWWWALPVLLLPILWHRQKREQTRTAPLATARFLPVAKPKELRVWRWNDVLLLLLRCLLLLALIALLADLVLPWRGATLLVVPGADPAFVAKEAGQAGLQDAQQLALPDRDAIGWLHAHEREFKPEARLVVVGDIAMPAVLPRLRHQVLLRPQAAAPGRSDYRVAVFSSRPEAWHRLFAALDGPRRYLLADAVTPGTGLVIWDRPEAPPAGLHAPLWWVADATAFPELENARQVDGMRYADSPRGRLWSAAGWPPQDADGARALFSAWHRLHLGVPPYTAPAQSLAPDANAPAGPASGALRDMLAALLAVLFALERILTHVRRR